MRCFFGLHYWQAWSEPFEVIASTLRGQLSIELHQKRICEKCNKMETRVAFF
jgi:hypothetical protein